MMDCLRRARVAGLIDWRQIADLDEGQLSAQLYRSVSAPVARISSPPLPDGVWAAEIQRGPASSSGIGAALGHRHAYQTMSKLRRISTEENRR